MMKKYLLQLLLPLCFAFLAKQTALAQYESNTIISINNISALISNTGNHFQNEEKIAQYNIPKGGNASTVYINNLWIGGTDSAGNLRLAAGLYGQTGTDYYTGPLSTKDASINEAVMQKWNRFFRVTKQEILDFLNPERDPSDIPVSLLEWPAHGDTSKGQAFYLAPYKDVNGDGVYNPHDGDYPVIKGDETVFFIFNDKYASHAASKGMPIGLEVHAMVYAFDAPDDTALNNTLFMNYKLYNRSSDTLYDTYAGLFTDFDIGDAYDDYIGCDVERSTYYGYNGLPTDGTGLNTHYGDRPPVQALTILGGPYLDADGFDNPSYRGDNVHGPSFSANYANDCEMVAEDGNALPFTWYSYPSLDSITQHVQVRAEGINGMNFGDGIIDNERYGMTKFVYFSHAAGTTGDPEIATDYYNFLRGIWRDNSGMRYGGNGHHPNDTLRPECNFMFSGISDPCNWGTNGVPPGIVWMEENEGNPPYDRKGTASMGPFTFAPGSMHELDFAFITVFPQDTLSAFECYGKQVDSIRENFFMREFLEDWNTGITDYIKKDSKKNIVLYPNPAQSVLYIQSSVAVERVRIYDISGRMLQQIANPSQEINVSDLANGIYLVKVKTAEGETMQKIIKN